MAWCFPWKATWRDLDHGKLHWRDCIAYQCNLRQMYTKHALCSGCISNMLEVLSLPTVTFISSKLKNDNLFNENFFSIWLWINKPIKIQYNQAVHCGLISLIFHQKYLSKNSIKIKWNVHIFNLQNFLLLKRSKSLQNNKR